MINFPDILSIPPSPFKDMFSFDEEEDQKGAVGGCEGGAGAGNSHYSSKRLTREVEAKLDQEEWGGVVSDDDMEEKQENDNEATSTEVADKCSGCGKRLQEATGKEGASARSVPCKKCGVLYCSDECKAKEENNHSDKCEYLQSIRLIEQLLGNEFGVLAGISGLEHDFLGGPKTNIVLRMLPSLNPHVFLFEDKDGNSVTVKFEGPLKLLLDIQMLRVQFKQIYLPVCWDVQMTNFISGSGAKHFGIVVPRMKELVFICRKAGSEDSLTQVVFRSQLFPFF